jgi:hypothetical protein
MSWLLIIIVLLIVFGGGNCSYNEESKRDNFRDNGDGSGLSSAFNFEDK